YLTESCFFFSSRRRHTRWPRDWSSDVCFRSRIAAFQLRKMRYRSTSRKAPLTSLRGAVLRGLAPDGGLYMPAEIARHSPEELEEFRKLPFTEVCFRVVKPFATPDVPEEVLWQIVSEAINFPVKLVSLSPGLHILELFHGPTLAFKDFGARFMARLMG